jgi:hypothetical protein
MMKTSGGRKSAAAGFKVKGPPGNGMVFAGSHACAFRAAAGRAAGKSQDFDCSREKELFRSFPPNDPALVIRRQEERMIIILISQCMIFSRWLQMLTHCTLTAHSTDDDGHNQMRGRRLCGETIRVTEHACYTCSPPPVLLLLCVQHGVDSAQRLHRSLPSGCIFMSRGKQ